MVALAEEHVRTSILTLTKRCACMQQQMQLQAGVPQHVTAIQQTGPL